MERRDSIFGFQQKREVLERFDIPYVSTEERGLGEKRFGIQFNRRESERKVETGLGEKRFNIQYFSTEERGLGEKRFDIQ